MANSIRAVLLVAFSFLVTTAIAATDAWSPMDVTLAGIVSGGTDGSFLIGRRTGQDPVRSTDGGRTWNSFTVLGTRPDRFIASPTDPRVFYAMTGGVALSVSAGTPSSLYRTRDGAITWELVAERFTTPSGAALTDLVVGADPNLLFAGRATASLCTLGCIYVGGEAFVSSDGGRSWKSIDAGIDTAIPPSTSHKLYPSPSHPSVVYAMTYTALLRSDDQGATWRFLRSSRDTHGVTAELVALDQQDPNIVYLLFNYPAWELWVTEDGGQTWRLSDPGARFGGGRALLSDPAERARAYYLGGQGEVFETRNAGRDWTPMAGGSGIAGLSASVGADRSPVVAAKSVTRTFAGFGIDGAAARLDLGSNALFLGSDHWWNPAEAGTGFSISQHTTGQLFVGWYAYDAQGHAAWRFISGGTWIDDRTFVGDVHETSGPPLLQGSFDAARVQTTRVGSATLYFDDADHATFSYSLVGETGEKRITRYLFGAPTFTLGGGDRNYSFNGDTWWNASESGWGVSLSRQYGKVFAIWYLYDEQGKPTWFVMPDANWSERVEGDRYRAVYQGDLYSASGPPSGAPFDPSRVQLTRVGSGSFTFLDTTARFDWTIQGQAGSRLITRLPF